ncbi:hypothetical protein EDD18DRAFT_1108031 [Armillaria luteobubalina]|uniref:Uncharacterized protein n=1 Tax=Armillaria luteobubalina TaxID=153913 RepID=A0AA39Q060_9AGAR|nr:hypothetical protein EDD18DRAFT_1108031 [Armillaria luteobubalina]
MTASIGISWEAEDIPLTSRQREGSISHRAKHHHRINISSLRFEDGGRESQGCRERERESIEVTEWLTKFHQIGIIDRDSILSVLRLPSIMLQDLLSNAGNCKDGKTLSVNDGCIGTYIEEHKIFITTPNGSFIPSPPSTMEILLHEDGHFSHHDPTRAPQFFDPKFCHFPVIPHRPGPNDDTHPYCNWLDTIWYDIVDADIVHSTGYLTHISLISRDVHSWFQRAFDYINERSSAVHSLKQFSEEFDGFLGLRQSNKVAAMQSYWLELVARLDYMDCYQPVMNGKARREDAPNSSHLMGTFTINLNVILKAEKPVVFPLNTSLPSPPFPVVFKGDPSHPQKFHAMHRFTQIFNTYRNPFNFITVSQSPVVHTQAVASSSSSTSATSCHPTCNQRGKGRVLGPLASAQASQKKKNNAIANINKFSECSQEHEEHSRLAQSQSNKGGAIAPSQDKGYVFPDPALLVYASAARQSSFFRNAQGTKAHDLMTQALGSALEAPGSRTTILQAPAPVCDQPVDVEKGMYFVWELCELNFHQELLSLDTHLTHPDLSAKEEDVINFDLDAKNKSWVFSLMGRWFH